MSCPVPVPYYLHSRTGQDFFFLIFFGYFLLSAFFLQIKPLTICLRRMLLSAFFLSVIYGRWFLKDGAKVVLLCDITAKSASRFLPVLVLSCLFLPFLAKNLTLSLAYIKKM